MHLLFHMSDLVLFRIYVNDHEENSFQQLQQSLQAYASTFLILSVSISPFLSPSFPDFPSFLFSFLVLSL